MKRPTLIAIAAGALAVVLLWYFVLYSPKSKDVSSTKDQVSEAIAGEGYRVFELPSGAGHDGMAMIDIADVAMLFVRCRGGISHHPDEHVDLADADAGARVLMRLIENFRPRDAAQ